MNETDKILIEYYTDPLCCWSWAFEQLWRKFITDNAGLIHWRYRMGGLLPDWKKYHDPLNDISKPAHMGPYWMQVKQITGAQIDESIWYDDPPVSSYPACIAVKCAEMQSFAAADLYLSALREAVMFKRKNISKRNVLIEIADELETRNPSKFSSIRFQLDFLENRSIDAFNYDLNKATLSNIGRFPGLVMQRPGEKGIVLIGYRPYPVLMQAFNQLKPEYAKSVEKSNS